ncbi:MAG: DDE-type integrase/transposase/recombinase [Planctomycetota bacterium]
MPKRRTEARVRRKAVALMEGAGVSLAEGMGLLGVRPATLRGWKRRRKQDALGPKSLGRPGYGCDGRTRGEIEDMARSVGPKVSVAYIRRRMGGVPRAIVEGVVRSCKKDFRRERRKQMETLRWEKPGAVWSCDWTEPETRVDGIYKEILAVRDLASHEALESLPCENRSAEMAAKAMEHLFLAHGSPLVMKHDGGSEFKAGAFSRLLGRYGVTRLLSPGYYPQYNGAIEAGIGSLKTHAWYEAAKNGRVGYWTCDDVEAGRLKANETSRPFGPKGPSPDTVWQTRRPITKTERQAFKLIVDEERRRASQQSCPPRTERQRKADERRAIQAALEKCGYLTVTRRRVSLRKT